MQCDCEGCDSEATDHVTEVVGGKPTERHLCEIHATDAAVARNRAVAKGRLEAFRGFRQDPRLRTALDDRAAREKVTARLLPALCLALLDERPEVRVIAAYQ